MIKLESIVIGMRVKGLCGEETVEVIATQSYGAEAVEVTWKGPRGFGERILYRDHEPRLTKVAESRCFAFDGDSHHFRMAFEALRIRLAHLFDPYAAVSASQIEPLPHQLTAVYGEMLDRQPLRFLLADDPGAGKTIMAGLLIKELFIRGSLERCLIIAPGSLVEQWQDELNEKFDLSFAILTKDQIESSLTGNPFDEHSMLIARLDMVARNDELKAKLEAAPEWDLIICDEAHRMSASFFGQEIKYTKRFQLGTLAGRRARHFLLMTATPHNGKEEDFQLFMGLLDADRFEGRFRHGVHKVNPSDMMRRLTKEELYRFDGSPLFPERRAYTVSYQLSALELELYDAVTCYVQEEMNRADRIERDGSRRRNNVGFALQILQRRLASSPAAIHRSLKRRLARLEARLEEEQHGGERRTSSTARGRAKILSALDDDEIEDATEEEIEKYEEQLLDHATAAQTVVELQAEIDELKRLERLASRLRESREDAKWLELDRILDDRLVHDPANDVARKVVIFTEARDTLGYLANRIRDRTCEAGSVAEIHGGVPRDRRREIIAAFNDDPEVRFLVANDAAGEGVNLQRGAHLMVNYDLPWNPNRLEQRFGRIHRIGQTEVCHLWNLVASETREGAVYGRLLEKLETARETLGGKVYDVLGELFESRPLRELFVEAIRYGEKPEVRERLFQTIDGVVDVAHINDLVARKKLTREGVDPETVRAAREQMERAAAWRLQPHHIGSFFEAAFLEAGGQLRAREKGRFEVTRVPDILKGSGGLIGRAVPVLPRYQRICFDKNAVREVPQAVLVAPGHPLLDSLLDLTLQRYRDHLQRGAILVDASDRHESPMVLVALRHAIRDGQTTRTGKPQLVSERLQFVWIDETGRITDGGPAPHLDYRAPSESEGARSQAFLNAPWLIGELEERAKGYSINELVPRHVKEVVPRRLAELEKIEAEVKERLDREIAHLQHRAFELEAEERAGKRPPLNSQNVRRQAEVLGDRLKTRLAEIAKQRDMAPLPPEICGAALVVPARLLQSDDPSSKTEEAPVVDDSDSLSRKEIEIKAMDEVMKVERSLGFEPDDISAQNRGYDIESRDPSTGRLRFIEVKGRRSDAREITVTRNEMLTALNAKEAYILATVLVERGRVHEPLYVTNPSRLFGAEPQFNEVGRSITIESIKQSVDARMRS